MKTLVTGAAGFIGSEVSLALLARGDEVVGLDNLNDYYDPTLKEARLNRIVGAASAAKSPGEIESRPKPLPQEHQPVPQDTSGSFEFVKASLEDQAAIASLFESHAFDAVINLAAQAGVRYSLENPQAYIDANIVGFTNILEGCRHHGVKHLVYASSSSVYGANENMPFSVDDNVDHPVSLYAASKKANELMAHTYSQLFGLPTTGLRFFTVYGPWGRPDMALFLFTKAILAGEPIDLFNKGKHTRDFTYIDDIVEGVIRVLDKPAQPDPEWTGKAPNPATSKSPWRVYNIGSNNPVKLEVYVETLEKALGKKAKKNLLPLQPGDVPDTYADVRRLEEDFGYRPSMEIEEGIKRFVTWYRDFYRV